MNARPSRAEPSLPEGWGRGAARTAPSTCWPCGQADEQLGQAEEEVHRRHVVARARGLGGGLPHDGVWDDEDPGKRQAEADDGGDGEGAPGGEGGGEQQRRMQQLERQQDAPLAPPPRGRR